MIQAAAVAMKVPVHVVFLTNGDNNEWSFSVYRKHPVLVPAAVRSMGEVRHDEAVAACRILGLKESDLSPVLGYPDFGLMPIFQWPLLGRGEAVREHADARGGGAVQGRS